MIKTVLCALLGLLVSGCADSGYNPSYIISDTQEPVELMKAPSVEQE